MPQLKRKIVRGRESYRIFLYEVFSFMHVLNRVYDNLLAVGFL